jgi:hypothetical protein
VNITDVSFAEGVTPEYANWGHNDGYIYLGGVSPDDVTGDHLLATLTVECVDGSCGSVDLGIVGGTDEQLIAGPGVNDPPHATIYPATWMGGSAQIVGCGDVDCGGGVAAADYFLLRAYVLGAPVSVYGWAADSNCGGGVAAADYFLLRAYVLGAPVSLGCCCPPP